MKKSWIVAKHEFATTVKRWGFLLVTFGFPLFMAGITGVSMMLQSKSMKKEQDKIAGAKVGFVDEAKIVTLDVPEGRPWRAYPSRAEARRQMGKDDVEIVFVLPKDYLEKGRVDVMTTIKPSLFNMHQAFVGPALEEWLARNVLKEVDIARVSRARNPAIENPPEYLTIEGEASTSERPEDYFKRTGTGLVFFFLMFFSTTLVGGYLIQGMADEKENRVLEMVISSMTPAQLMTGKLIGLGAVGMLQIIIWLATGITTASALIVSFALDPRLFLVCALFYVLNYVLLGALLLGVGSLGSNQREAGQYTWIISIGSVFPVFVWTSIISEPHGVLARVFSYIPLTSPSTMMLRYGVDAKGMPWWEIPLVVVIMAVSIGYAIRFSARLYRAGLLLYGKRPTLKEIWRWVRE